jgi:medium-chain acyl-[acyl-carrier-protein] hydrolase
MVGTIVSDPARWISYRRSLADSRLRLFCFPFGGGGASTFAHWATGLPSGVDVYPMQPPGRESRANEPAITRLPQLVGALVEVMETLLDLPFALFGHSIGALTAFELARQLRRQGLRQPQWLFVSGHPSAELPRRRPAVSRLSRSEFVAALRDQFGVTPALLENAALLDLILPTLYADYELVESYRYDDEPPLAMPISAFGGNRDPEATEEEVLAWRRHTTGPFSSSILEGDHMFVSSARQSLLREVGRDLARLLAADP